MAGSCDFPGYVQKITCYHFSQVRLILDLQLLRSQVKSQRGNGWWGFLYTVIKDHSGTFSHFGLDLWHPYQKDCILLKLPTDQHLSLACSSVFNSGMMRRYQHVSANQTTFKRYSYTSQLKSWQP